MRTAGVLLLLVARAVAVAQIKTFSSAARGADVSSLLLAKDAPPWIVVDADEPVGMVANRLVSAGRGSCALIARDGFIVGIFTERDYLAALNVCDEEDECVVELEELERRTVELIASSVSAFATSDLLIVEPSCSVVRALSSMAARN